MKKYNFLTVSVFAGMLVISVHAIADETAAEKAAAMGDKTVDTVKRTYRNAKDELCEMVDGKAKCVVQKVVHKVKNAADKIETTAAEAKNKVD